LNPLPVKIDHEMSETTNKSAQNTASLTGVNLRVMGFSTTHTLAQAMAPEFTGAGFRANITEAGFGEIIPELLQPVKGVDAYVIMLDMAGFFPRDWRLEPDKAAILFAEKLDMLSAGIKSCAENTGAHLMINTLPSPVMPTAGHIDQVRQDGERHMTELLNRRLVELAGGLEQVVLVDSDIAMRHIAPVQRHDPKMWFYGRIPYSMNAMRALAGAVARVWQRDKTGTAKVLALDFDNTLWGGVYGDDGIDGLACGDDFPGNAYKAFQAECLRLKAQGMLLVGLSKNNPQAMEVFSKHEGMSLQAEDFLATRINWNFKPDNIKEIAAELNVGLDSFLFIDDSPHEREAMRVACPQVQVPEMPSDPAVRPGWLREMQNTWPVRLTKEDAKRSQMYKAEQKATELRNKVASIADYLRGLEQQLLVEESSTKTLVRIAQMHIRTNQFNLTTERFDEAEIGAMLADRQKFMVVHGQVVDKFGDHGIVICVTVRLNGKTAHIQSLLMSCRVIGREIELAFLGKVLAMLKARGVREVSATYIPTAKNSMVSNFYQGAGFNKVGCDGNNTLWQWQLGTNTEPKSDFVAV
jgi:FkbH-like protein